MIVLTVPIQALSPNATRAKHWRFRYRHDRAARDAVQAAWLAIGRPKVELPCRVIMTRIAWRQLDDDNLTGALKSTRDEIAVCLGLKNDRDKRVEWICREDDRLAKRGEYAVKITIISTGKARSEPQPEPEPA